MRYISDKAIIIEPCVFANNVYIGPYSIIGPNVKLGENTWIDSHTIIIGPAVIGSNNKFFSFSNIGGNFKTIINGNNNITLRIGNNNVFRESVSIERGSVLTSIGDNNYFMINSNISNDCVLKSNIVFSYNVVLGCHVFVDNFVTLSKFVSIHDHVNIGSYSFIASNSIIYKDILPYSLISGFPASIKNVNLVCLKKLFFDKSKVLRLKKIYKLVFSSNLTIKQLIFLLLSKKYFSIESELIVNFLLLSKKGILRQ